MFISFLHDRLPSSCLHHLLPILPRNITLDIITHNASDQTDQTVHQATPLTQHEHPTKIFIQTTNQIHEQQWAAAVPNRPTTTKTPPDPSKVADLLHLMPTHPAATHKTAIHHSSNSNPSNKARPRNRKASKPHPTWVF